MATQNHRRPIARKGYTSQKRSRIAPLLRVVLGLFALCAAILVWAIAARSFAAMANSPRTTFDAIVVLGTPADDDGNPTPQLLDRISEAVHEYERGVAPRLIVTGAAAHNQFVEAEVMARVAESQGVPASVIFPEPYALDTIQNACYSARIMKANGWHSAEVVSSASHLPRAAMIFAHVPDNGLQWRMHPAPDALTSSFYSNAAVLVETLKTARYLVWTRWTEACTP